MAANRAHRTWIALGLAAATLAVYAPAFGAAFLNFDDGPYITHNPDLRLGLGWEGIRWAFTTTLGGSWQPLTWLSLLLDQQLFGLDPVAVHGTNVILHALATALLFLSMARLTGAMAPSAFVAAVFGLHPAHVESVAWAVERKDVLSAVFFALTIWVYAAAVRSGSRRALHFGVPSLLALGLMSKPMLVTVPLLLLLLDDWPLGRLRAGDGRYDRARVRSAVLEKLPLVLLSALVALVTFLAQRSEGAVGSLVEYPTGLRLMNALVAYVRYLGMAVWPVDLAVLYPYDDALALWRVLGSAALLAAISAAVWRLRARQPHLLVGWLWYLGMLVPVLGLVQVGFQSMADRYTYLPFIGLSVMLAWSAPAWLARARLGPRAVVALACAALGLLGVLTFMQARLWRDPLALFAHTVEVTRDNFLAQQQLAWEYAQRGDVERAESHYLEALRLYPHWSRAELGLAGLRDAQGRRDEALRLYRGVLSREFEVQAANNAAWILATREYATPDDAREALRLATRAAEATRHESPRVLDTLAAAQAASGHWGDATHTAGRAASLARAGGELTLAREIDARRERYRRRAR